MRLAGKRAAGGQLGGARPGIDMVATRVPATRRTAVRADVMAREDWKRLAGPGVCVSMSLAESGASFTLHAGGGRGFDDGIEPSGAGAQAHFPTFLARGTLLPCRCSRLPTLALHARALFPPRPSALRRESRPCRRSRRFQLAPRALASINASHHEAGQHGCPRPRSSRYIWRRRCCSSIVSSPGTAGA